MINKTNPNLAINGGTPVSKEPIIIHKPYLAAADRQALLNAFDSTFISGDGPACREFESKLARYLGVQHALYVNSATSALELAFRVKDFPPGAEVIVPDFTYTSSALGPLYNNLKVVLCDVYPDNGSIDVGKLESYITDKTVAIVPVDYAGIPADMGEVNRIAQIHGLYVVHDTAQSLGAEYKGRKTGSLADLSTFSFHGTKNITTGEGGAITTNDSKLAERIKILREKGTNKYSFLTDNITRGYYEYVDIGNSYVQSNLLGALGASQMRSIGHIYQARREIAEYYLQELDGLPRLKAHALTDNVPLMTAWGNDTEYANIFSEPLKNYMEPKDILIAISASGNSPNVLRALEVARQIGGVTVGLTGDTGGRLRELTDHCVHIPDWHIGRQEDGHMILDR